MLSECAAECEPIRAGLFLHDRPRRGIGRARVRLQALQFHDQVGPLDARFRCHESVFAIEHEHAFERPHIEHPSCASELLSAHGMTAA